MMKLYEMAAEYRADRDKLQNLDLPPEVVLDTLESMQGELIDKIKAVMAVSLELQALAEVRAECARKMAESAQAVATRAEGLRAYAQGAIEHSGLTLPLKFPEFTVNLQKNPLSCEIEDAQALPAKYKVTDVSFRVSGNGEAFLAALQALIAQAADRRHGLDATIADFHAETRALKKDVLDELKRVEKQKQTDLPATGSACAPTPESLPGARLNPIAYRVTVR